MLDTWQVVFRRSNGPELPRAGRSRVDEGYGARASRTVTRPRILVMVNRKGAPFGNLPDEQRCQAKAKGTGVRCQKPRMSGLTVCRTHGGATPTAVAKSRKARETIRMERRRSIAPVRADSDEARGDGALSMEIRRTVGWIHYCEDKIAELEGPRLAAPPPSEAGFEDPLAAGLSWGRTERETMTGVERGEPTEYAKEKWSAGVNVWEEKLRWNRAHLKDLTRQWIAAGFEAKRLEILQRTLDLFEKTLDGIVRDLGHNPRDAQVRRIIRDRLQQMNQSRTIDGDADDRPA